MVEDAGRIQARLSGSGGWHHMLYYLPMSSRFTMGTARPTGSKARPGHGGLPERVASVDEESCSRHVSGGIARQINSKRA